MRTTERPPLPKVRPGDVTRRVAVEQLGERGVNVLELVGKLVDATCIEFTAYYSYTILRMHLAGYEDYKVICEDVRLEHQVHFELVTPRIYELGGSIPSDIRQLPERVPCPGASLPAENGVHGMLSPEGESLTAAQVLEVLLETERCAIRSWSEICDLTFGKDPRTYEMAAHVLSEEVEHEAWFIELLSKERDGIIRPAGRLRNRAASIASYPGSVGTR